MLPNHHPVLMASSAKKLNTPLKASVVILSAIILSSCASSGGDNATSPNPTPVLPGDGGNAGGSGAISEFEKAIKAAEAKTKIAEEALKVAESKTKAATEALKTAEEKFGKESKEAAAAAKAAIDTANVEAIQAKSAAEAARIEAVAKIEAAAKASAVEVDAAKKAAAEAVAKVKNAEDKVQAADARVLAAETKSKEVQESLNAEIAAKEEAQQQATSANNQATAAQAQAVLEKQKAAAAQDEADKAKGELAAAAKALADAEQALADALASGSGNSAALQAEVDRRKAALDAANAQIIAAQQAQAEAASAVAAQIAAANKAAQEAKDALKAATIKKAPESKKSGVQSLNIDPTPAGLPDAFKANSRDFEVTVNSVEARADIASGGLLPIVNITTSGADDTNLQGGFKSHDDSTGITTTALGVLPLTYTSTYKDFGDDMRIGHIDGAAAVGTTQLPVNGVATIGNATQAANMPTEGKVGYTGDATYRKLGLGQDIEFGKSVFTADFVAKNVKGDLTFANAGKIGLTAGINGNQFSGTAASNAGYATEGGFFGGDAQYLGGVYEGNGAQGTYGAKSDKQTAAQQAAAEAQAAADKANAAIAAIQAQAAAAQAAADKAKADAAKAQAALQRAEEALANAGNGTDQLAAALARAEAAEAAEAAAQQAASAADAARVAAQAAQAAAEDAALKAQAAADKAVGDAKVEKEAKEKALQAQKAAETAKHVAEAAKAESEIAKNEAIVAKASAERARDEAIARAEAAEAAALEAAALEAANKFTAPDSRVSGVQSTSLDSDDRIFDNNSNSYNKLKVYANELDGRASLKPIDIMLKGTDGGATDKTYGTSNNGFKEYKNDISFEGRLSNTVHKRNFSYSSVYKNFDDQMQIGHIFGDIKSGTIASAYNKNLSTTYVQGNATNLSDMDKLANINEGKANYKGVATYVEGGKIAVDGTSKFDVDFVAKSVKGELNFADKQVDIAADISNNTFASKKGAAVNTVGGFYGKGAGLLGGVYEREIPGTNYIKGTYGATKLDPTVEVVPDPTESKMTGFQSTALSSKEKTLPFGLGKLDNAIGYVQIRDDKSDFKQTENKDGSIVPIDNREGDNFTNFNTGVVRGDMVKPESVLTAIAVSLTNNGSVTVDAGKGGSNPTFKYNAVYKNFDNQMQVGHVYGNFDSLAGEVSRAANVYVQGYLTSQAGMDNLKNINDGKAQYNGVATYIENIHLADNASTAPVNGTSAFNVDFVNGSVDGTLSFTGTGYKYMPAGSEIKIDATITGNTFASNAGGIDTAGGFYGEGAKFLGGIYQDASVQGGKGTIAGTGTKFQGTFGAEKQ
ncbi:transferrin-binding protein-like solute binding protein [Psychrobacter cryohalolentis]|uniref:transferrin-binding protein-like solute binding protein n=1 Tax=Psychrobacter sp. D2 TaxID=2759702 RepID=UPI0015E5EA37|nr:transferrin-binding protein-like solute binding protein [Psychrobacter sp. D2]MBA2057412.1 transferrin-binding protein-like solute binding protein [Psychrobacter sp. D2]